MTEFVLGILAVVNVYLFIQWRNERRARHNQFSRLEKYFYNHIESEKKVDGERNLGVSNALKQIHHRITALDKKVEEWEQRIKEQQ